MIDNTCTLVDGPLYTDREEALAAPGAIFVHVKKGGIYRKIVVATYAGDKCKDELDKEPMSVYEHLWPHKHGFYTRPDSEFEELVSTGVTGYPPEHPRFDPQIKD